MATLTAKLLVDFSAKEVSALDLATVSAPAALKHTYSFASGTGSNQADRIWSDTRTLAASATEDLDLAGSLTGALGTTLTFATLKGIIVKAASGNTNNVVISRPAANGVPVFEAASDAVAVKPGGVFVWLAPATGVTVTAGTGDLITFTNSAAGTSVSYDVVFLGTSA